MPDNAPILSVRNLSKRFGGLHAVESVSFDLMNGEILGLLGPNGAGKTTCFNMISGVYAPTEGTIHFLGRRTDGLEPHEMAGLGVGRTFQIVRPFASMTVAENVMTALGQSNYTGLHALVRAWNTRAARLRADRLDVFGCRAGQGAVRWRLCRIKTRGGRLYQTLGGGVWQRRHQNQCHLPRHHPHCHDGRNAQNPTYRQNSLRPLW